MTLEDLFKKCKTLGVTKREIDYWSSLGMIRFDRDPNNGYRIYEKEAVEDINLIVMIKSIGMRPLKQMYDIVKANPILYGTLLVSTREILEYTRKAREKQEALREQFEQVQKAYEDYKKYFEGL